jgi:hypothetical protein
MLVPYTPKPASEAEREALSAELVLGRREIRNKGCGVRRERPLNNSTAEKRIYSLCDFPTDTCKKPVTG